MGCKESKPAGSKGGAKPVAKPVERPNKHLNPKDFILSKRVKERVVKQEGTINGEQFNIEECQDCDIFLLDHIATVFIDECADCRIFLGPVASSVFLRNCKNCSLMIACQQFRSRDCEFCRLALFCTTDPIIETSKAMEFACFDFTYFTLRSQLTAAGLLPWNNKWSQVYDFNKNPERPNWSLFPQEEVAHMLRLEACAGAVQAEELQMDKVIPVTLGSRPRPSQDSCLVLFLPKSEQYIEGFLGQASKSPGWSIVRTRNIALQEEQLKTLFSWAKEPKLASQLKGQDLTGVELCGQGIFAAVSDAVKAPRFSSAGKSLRIVPEVETLGLAKVFFEVWKDEI